MENVRVIFWGRSYFYFMLIVYILRAFNFNETVVPLALVGYEINIANSALSPIQCFA